jgi:hypothetical protein
MLGQLARHRPAAKALQALIQYPNTAFDRLHGCTWTERIVTRSTDDFVEAAMPEVIFQTQTSKLLPIS